MAPLRVVIDTERVIAEVRARPQIWQPKHRQYKSRDARQQAWAEIGRVLVPALGDLSRADQNEIEKKIQQRWRTARDSFVKARAQQVEAGGAGGAGGACARERNYGYFDAMLFLEPTLRPPVRAPPPAPPAPPARRLVRRVRARARVPLEPQRRGRHTPLDEDDDDFFKSLAPMLRALHTEQKLTFRSRVLALALQVQAQAHAAHYLELQPPAPDSHYHAELGPDMTCMDEAEDALETKYCPPAPPPPDTAC